MSAISLSNECFHNFHGDCEICRCGCHEEYPLKLKEMKALARILEKQYIAYDDLEAHEVVNKIFRIVREHENMA